MKRFLSAILAIAALFCMGSCAKDAGDGSINSSSDTLKQEDNISNQPSRDASSTSQEPLKDGMDLQNPKQLVVYFSRTGNTQAVAQEIVSQTGAVSFEILPKEPYVEDYDELLDIARDEQNSGARPEILNQAENLQQYDTIYIGYPIWYGDMPMILYSFLENCDFIGKDSSALSHQRRKWTFRHARQNTRGSATGQRDRGPANFRCIGRELRRTGFELAK